MSVTETAAAPAPPRGKKAVQARIVAQAERFAKMLADAPNAADDPLAPPAFITDARLAPALQVWKDRAPEIARRGCLRGDDRLAFALLCVYTADFVMAQDELLEKGFAISVPTVAGGEMLRANPALARRDTAASMIIDLAARFGMTPLDRYKLFGMKSRVPEGDLPDGDLFERPAPRPAVAAGDPAAAAAPAPTRWDTLLGPRVRPN